MPYTNTTVTTSVSGSWNGTSISYSTIELIDGIPHSAQIEVERIFTIDRSGNPITTFLNNSATTEKDKREVFVIPVSRITFNETNKTITAIDLPSTGNTYDFNPEGVGVSNVPVPAINAGNTLKIRRKTVSNQALVTWSAGTKLTSNQLNLETTQLLHLVQEVIDKITTETTVTNTTIGSVPDSSITPAKLSGGSPYWTLGGNVGVGTSSPSNRLHVHENASSLGVIQLTTTDTGTTSTDGLALGVSSTATSLWNYENLPLVLGTNATERLRITAGGNVGIGTSSPATKLHISGSAITNESIYLANSSSNSFVQMFAAGSTGVPAAGVPANSIWIEGAPASSGNTYLSSYYNLLGFATGTSRLERMRIENGGDVIIGNVNAAGNTTRYLDIYNYATGASASSAIRLITHNTTGSPSSIGQLVKYQTGGFAIQNTDTNAAANMSFFVGSSERMRIDSSGDVNITSTTSSTTTTTGALKVAGGVGIVGALNVGGTISGSTVGGLSSSLLPTDSILQVIYASTATVSSHSTTYANTNITASITPKRATSKILILSSVHTYLQGSDLRFALKATRDNGSTVIDVSNSEHNYIGYSTGGTPQLNNQFFTAQDSPNTTTSLTYRIAARHIGGTATVANIGIASSPAGRSSIILVEIA